MESANQGATPVAHYLPKSYLPSLDGLRGIALLMVLVYHTTEPSLASGPLCWGWTGVDLFFVLSGFLITGILFDTRAKANYFHDFFVRRALRIFPAYYFLWALLLLASLLFHGGLNRYNLSFLYYGGNMIAPYATFHHETSLILPLYIHGHQVRIGLAAFWSLCVEEQFYLLWPVIVWLAPGRRFLMKLSGAAIIGILCLRIFLVLHCSPAWLQTNFIYTSFYTRADTLLVGSFLALWMRGPTQVTVRRYKHLYASLFSIPLLVLVSLHNTVGLRWPDNKDHPFRNTIDGTLIALMFAGLLLAALDSGLWRRLLSVKWLTSVGRVSYGMYLYHYLLGQYFFPLAVAMKPLRRYHLHATTLITVFVACGSYCAAWLSYRYLEAPCLRLKDKLAPTHGAEARIEGSAAPNVQTLRHAGVFSYNRSQDEMDRAA
jgi:peptidoglycan/LPS O-acetylase OafA/YrhL